MATDTADLILGSLVVVFVLVAAALINLAYAQ